MILLVNLIKCQLSTSDMREYENLHGCYLLHNNNPRYKGRTYIGYTVDPVQRIGQHNLGAAKGQVKCVSTENFLYVPKCHHNLC